MSRQSFRPSRFRPPCPRLNEVETKPDAAMQVRSHAIGLFNRREDHAADWPLIAETLFRAAFAALNEVPELTHWTGHPSRLDRQFGKRFADKAYAFEEVVAELGSAFLSANLDLTPESLADHDGYLSHWLGILKTDKRAIFTAASQAQRAADYLHGQPVRRLQVA